MIPIRNAISHFSFHSLDQKKNHIILLDVNEEEKLCSLDEEG